MVSIIKSANILTQHGIQLFGKMVTLTIEIISVLLEAEAMT